MLSDNDGRIPFTENKIDSMPRKWRSLTKSILFENPYYEERYITSYFYQHMGILTGRKSGITVIEYNYYSSDKMKTLCVRTCMLHKCVIYQYEPLLHSIYSSSGSILNDGCCIFFGYSYKITEDMPITKMPDSVLSKLLTDQNNRDDKIYHTRIFELMMILPDI